MLSLFRSPFLCLRSLCRPTVRCATAAAAPHRSRYLGIKPETIIASKENQYYRIHLEAMQPAIAITVSDVPAAVQKLEAIYQNGKSLESPEYVDIVRDVAKFLAKAPQEQVIYVLNLLAYASMDFRRFENRNNIWSSLDSALARIHKSSERTPENLLQALDYALLLCMANPGRTPNYALNLSGSFVQRLNSIQILSKEKLLKLLFILNLARNPLPATVARDLETRILNVVDNMTIEEYGLVAAAFFKTQTAITNPVLISKMINKAMIGESRISSNFIALSSILKVLKLSNIVPESVPAVRKFIDSFKKEELMQMTPTAVGHLCRLAKAFHKYSPLVLESAIERLSATIKSGEGRVRFKDVLEILRSCDDFSYPTKPALVNQIIASWPSPDEVFQYPSTFISYLCVLALLGYYPDALIEKCFSSKFLQHAQERCDPFPHIQLLSLHTILSIDCYPKFNGHLLRDDEVDNAVRRIGRVDVGIVMDKRSRPDTFTASNMKRLFWLAKDRFGARAVFAFILPYANFPEIVILAKDQDIAWLKTRKLVPGAFTGASIFNFETRQHYADNQTSIPRNYHSCKKKLLQKLAFTVVTVNFADISLMSDRMVVDEFLSKVE